MSQRIRISCHIVMRVTRGIENIRGSIILSTIADIFAEILIQLIQNWKRFLQYFLGILKRWLIY